MQNHELEQLSEQLLQTQAAMGKPEQAGGSGLLEGFSQLVSDFIETSRNFILDFLHKKTDKNCESHMSALSRRTVLIFRILKNIFLETLFLLHSVGDLEDCVFEVISWLIQF